MDEFGTACHEIKRLQFLRKELVIFTGILIAAANFIFKFIVGYNVRLLGIDSITKEIKILKVVFTIVSIFNNCFIILIIGADFEFSKYYFNG